MVKIRVFIPHLDLEGIIRDVVDKLPKYEGIQVETTYVFGTPKELSQNEDADILVARGMTYDVLRELFPDKHIIQIHLNSFDIFSALVECRKLHPAKIALCLHNIKIDCLPSLEEFCGAPLTLFEVPNEETAERVVRQAAEDGADVFVGAGTMCGICDRLGLKRVHIYTKQDSIEKAMNEALETAITIHRERTRSDIINVMLNRSEDGIVAVNAEGQILNINNQAHRMLRLPANEGFPGQSASSLVQQHDWKQMFRSVAENEKALSLDGTNYYVKYKPLNDRELGSGGLIYIKNCDQIIEEESKIRRALSEKGLTARYSFQDILGSSGAIRENIRIAERYGRVNSNVLIMGETGTGKELFAHSIHQASSRRNQPFVALNCAALPENLLESELFGYEEGAFSGASRGGKIGLFELAHKGSIFLDEIGEIPPSLQAKLLRVLQEKEIRRIGSTSVHPVDVRVISATNVRLEEKIQEGKFRSDLYYRLNILEMFIPPLRERKEDIQILADAYLARFACEMEKSVPTLTPGAMKLLREYEWPGNVRELRNIFERLTVLNDGDVIDEDLLRQMKVFGQPPKHGGEAGGIDPVYSRLQPKKKKKDLAEELGVSRSTLWRMAKKQRELERSHMEETGANGTD